MIDLIIGLVEIAGTLLKMFSDPTKEPDPESVRVQLLRANRLVSDEMMRRGIV
jgi:hypothetical protein